MHAAAAAIQLFNHKTDGHAVGRDSTVFLGDPHQAKPGIAIGLGNLIGHAVCFVHLLDDILGEVALTKLAHTFKQ